MSISQVVEALKQLQAFDEQLKPLAADSPEAHTAAQQWTQYLNQIRRDNPTLASLYERIRRKLIAQGKRVVVTLHGTHCPGCWMRLHIQALVKLRAGEAVVCEHCQRILVS